jgi:hypothetical protein
MYHDDLRRVPRVSVCCHVVVRDRHRVWTAVTDDICSRGCGIVTPKQPRPGSLLTLTLSSDLFSEELDVIAETVWGTEERIGVSFVEPIARQGALSPPEWLERVIEHGRAPGQLVSRITPVVLRARPRQDAFPPIDVVARAPPVGVNENILRLVVTHR